MATDFWPDEEGLIVQGLDIGFFTASGIVTEGKPVKLGTGAAGLIKCQNGAAVGDAFGIALKSASTGAMVPVAITGVIKVLVDGNTPSSIVTGDFLMNSALVVIDPTITSATLKVFEGSSYVLGVALQPSTAASDEILILLGKTA